MTIYHNPLYFDAYTLVIEPWYNGKSCEAYAFSENADSPQGFNQFIGEVYEGEHLGKAIKLEDCPNIIKQAIADRLN